MSASGFRKGRKTAVWSERKTVHHSRGSYPTEIDVHYHKDGSVTWSKVHRMPEVDALYHEDGSVTWGKIHRTRED